MVNTNKQNFDRDANVDPLSGEVGSHPVGTGVGTLAGGIAGGAAAGAAIGTAAGPVGTLAGAIAGTIVGGVAGAYAGRDIAEAINPTEINLYWMEHYSTRPYVEADADYETYKPAYLYGYEARTKYANKKFEDIESDLSKDWFNAKQTSPLEWNDAKEAVRDSYDHTDRLYRERLNNKK